ncbi:MAG: hypothetical protein M1514_01600 [Patescibacteria group bacterium]|nr:hypothetical protein [Patescibacteria group bacterium]
MRIIVGLTFFLLLGYALLNRDFFSLLAFWKTRETREHYSYNQGSLQKIYEYASVNIFDKGYVRDTGLGLLQRLSVFPQGTLLKESNFLIKENSPEMIIKIVLPKGFKDGILSFKAISKSRFNILVSYDQKTWEAYSYPGFPIKTTEVLPLKNKNPGCEAVYVKPSSLTDDLSINFDAFQYLADPLPDKDEYGLIFFPDYELDLNGKKIDQPGIVYEKKISQENH